MPWMTDLFYDVALNAAQNPFRNRPLHQITIPGTHDSGCYRHQLIHDVFSVTQTQTIFQQLAGGIRYFDIRPCYSGNEYWTYHGPAYYGDQLTGEGGILAQIYQYFNSLAPTDRELVVINVSHFYNFTNDLHRQLVQAIQDKLQNHLLRYSQFSINLFDRPYWQLLSNPDNGGAPPVMMDQANMRSRVVVLYDGALDTPVEPYVSDNPFLQTEKDLLGTTGFFVLSPKYKLPNLEQNQIRLFDQYSNKARVEEGYVLSGIRTDQLDKLRNRRKYPYTAQAFSTDNWTQNAVSGVHGTLHLLSWTLTPQGSFGTWEPCQAAQDYANPALLDLFSNPRRDWDGICYNPVKDAKINIIYVDNYASERHRNALSPWYNYALPVAIAARMNIGPVGQGVTW